MKKLVAFVMLAMIACPGVSLGGDASSDTQGGTVKSSKSNSSERVGAAGEAGGDGATEKAAPEKGNKSESDKRTTVKSGKSNSSD